MILSEKRLQVNWSLRKNVRSDNSRDVKRFMAMDSRYGVPYTASEFTQGYVL